MNPVIVTVTGPSLSGKSTLVKHLVNETDIFTEMVSYTTRPKRQGEVFGTDYYFVTEGEFSHTPMVELVELNGSKYGVSAKECQKACDSGKTPIVIMDPQGIWQVRKFCEDRSWTHLSVFMNVPINVRLERFCQRIIDDSDASPEVYAKRLTMMTEDEPEWHLAFPYTLALTPSDSLHLDRATARIIDLVREPEGQEFDSRPFALEPSDVLGLPQYNQQ